MGAGSFIEGVCDIKYKLEKKDQPKMLLLCERVSLWPKTTYQRENKDQNKERGNSEYIQRIQVILKSSEMIYKAVELVSKN